MGVCLSQDLVERYVEGNCSSDEQQTVEVHSAQCENCRQRIESARSNTAADGKSDPMAVNSNITDTVTQEIQAEPEKYATKSMAEESTYLRETQAYKSDYDFSFEGYKIISQIGEGGVGTVWRALQLSTHREVALKVLGTGTFASEKARLRFEREVELTARLEHPNIARIYESGLNRGVYYYTMELFEGEHLDKYIQGRELTQREILELIHNVCQTVQYAHQRGVIHRDLKPPNIIVTGDGEPHILDFGLAKTFLEDDKSVTVSLDGDVAGTPAFMSPEQAAGDLNAIDTRSDVYSLGVILFYVLTNRSPYDLSGSHYQILKSIQEQEPIRPSKLIPHLDGDIEAILLKALAKKPAERYQSAAELARDIQCWRDGLPIIARSVNTLYLVRKLITRHRTASIILCLLLVIILSSSVISSYYYSQSRGTVKKLESEREAFKEAAKKYLTFANQALFAIFLEMWYADDPRAQAAVIYFSPESQERLASLFLLDPRPLAEKKGDFHEKLSVEQPYFWELLVAEYHLKNKNEAEAIEAYKRCLEGCLEAGEDLSESDTRVKDRARAKLAELSGENIPLKACPLINRGQ